MSKRTSLSISARRHFVDQFFFSKSNLISGKIIDIGGKKKNKRGIFDIDNKYGEVTYVNIDESTNPDIVADAASIPVAGESYDTAILGEILEHVSDPIAVLRETKRLLRHEGKILVTVPFMAGIHGDPHDYGRYTETFWQKAAENLGLKILEIEKQGTIFAVFALMIQHLFLSKGVSWRPIQIPLIKFLMWLDKRTTHKLLTAWTTGYGIVFTK
ncbi:MAG TPA: methyltransferase domain-containing protein [Candidatus Paceibacterota bacterium]